MKPDETSSVSSSDTTSRSERKGEPTGTEAEFLRRQAEQAKAAMQRVLQELQQNLRDGADVKQWTKEYPWAAVGSAAALGFLAATALVPSKREQALQRLREIEKALYPDQRPAAVAQEDGKHEPHGQRGLMSTLMRELMRTVGPGIVSAISAGVTAKAANQQDQPQPPPRQTL